MYIDLIVIRRAIEFKQMIFVKKARVVSKTLFKLTIWKQDITVLKRYLVLYINCAKGIIFGLETGLNVIIFLLICHLLSPLTW